MAGGKGTRLRMGEKPLVELLGRPLIDYVVSALRGCAVDRIYIATTANVPLTRRWAEGEGLVAIETDGIGFVSDMVQAVVSAGILQPVLIVMADLPLIEMETIREVLSAYGSRPEPALSVHTPLELHRRIGHTPDALFNYKGRLIVPAGINILDGAAIKTEQEDYHLIMDRVELAANVNTKEDLELCERLLVGIRNKGV